MSDEKLIGVDPLDWMNKKEVDDCKKEISGEATDSDNKNSSGEAVVKLDSQFDIRKLGSLNEKLQELINSEKTIKIDASEVVKIDAAAMQLLSSFKKTAEDKLIDVHFDNPNESFLKAASLMGLESILLPGS